MNRSWVATDASPHFPVDQWVDDGARLVGGCCRVTPDDIATMAAQLSGSARTDH